MHQSIVARSSVTIRTALALALAMAGCQDPASPKVLQMDQVVGEYALISIAGSAVPTPFAGTRMSQWRTVEGSITLRIDGTYTTTETSQSRYQDSGNPFDPGPHISTYTGSDSGTFEIVGDSVLFTQAEGEQLAAWSAFVDATVLHSNNNARVFARVPSSQ